MTSTGFQDAHLAPNTSEHIVSNPVCRGAPRSVLGSWFKKKKMDMSTRATLVTLHRENAMLCLSYYRRSDTYPYVDILEDDVNRWPLGNGVEGQRGPAVSI